MVDISLRRLHWALGIVSLLILAVAISGVAERAVAGGAETGAGLSTGLPELNLQQDPGHVLEEIEQSIQPNANLPDMAFLESIGLPDDAHDVRIDGTQTVLSFKLPGDATQVLDELNASYEEQGWAVVPLGDVLGATCLRNTGDIRWFLVTCTQVDDATIVVVRMES